MLTSEILALASDKAHHMQLSDSEPLLDVFLMLSSQLLLVWLAHHHPCVVALYSICRTTADSKLYQTACQHRVGTCSSTHPVDV